MYLALTDLVGAGAGLGGEFLTKLDVGADVECGSVLLVDNTGTDDIAEVLGRVVARVGGGIELVDVGADVVIIRVAVTRVVVA